MMMKTILTMIMSTRPTIEHLLESEYKDDLTCAALTDFKLLMALESTVLFFMKLVHRVRSVFSLTLNKCIKPGLMDGVVR